MKTLAIYFILAASVIADTLPELVAQAKADGIGPNLVDIAKHLNAPRYTTTSTTNNIAKPAELIAVEASILAEIVATGIDSTAAIEGGWAYIIEQLDSAFEAAPDRNRRSSSRAYYSSPDTSNSKRLSPTAIQSTPISGNRPRPSSGKPESLTPRSPSSI